MLGRRDASIGHQDDAMGIGYTEHSAPFAELPLLTCEGG
jgi:hypothetical protein